MRKTVSVVLIFFLGFGCFAQQTAPKQLTFGIEQDILPYLTGGYFAGLWAGKDHLRARALTAYVNKPRFITKKGFTNNKVTAYAFVADYFLKENWNGWWAGTGLIFWKSSIQADARVNTSTYQNWLLNGSIGYNIGLGNHCYISPWAGLHFRIAGDKEVAVDNKLFTPSFVNPEASVKIGVSF
jgi:hypothetical protein